MLTGENFLLAYQPLLRFGVKWVCGGFFSFFAILHTQFISWRLDYVHSVASCALSLSTAWALWRSIKDGMHCSLVWCPLLYLGTEWGVRVKQPPPRPQPPYLKLRRMAEAMTRAEKERA